MTEVAKPDTLPLAKPRVEWVDYAKGLSILFVVVYHVWNGIMSRADQIPSPEAWYDPINRGFEMMRMPLFFFVSGLFVGRSAQKEAGRFVVDKLGAILWPYWIWSTIHVLVTIGLARLSGGKTDLTLSQLPYYVLVDPVAQFWFLYVLFLSLMLYLLLAKLRTPTWLILLVGLGLMLVKLNVNLSGIGFETERYHISLAHWGPLYQVMSFFIYMAMGAVLAPVLLKKLNKQRTLLLLAGTIASAAIVVTAIAVGDRALVRRDADLVLGGVHVPLGIVFALTSVAGALCAAELMERAKGFAFIRSMGRFSLYIFVLHVIFAAAVRTVLLKAGVQSFAIHMVTGLAVGIGVPIAVAMIVKRAKLTWLFTLRPG